MPLNPTEASKPIVTIDGLSTDGRGVARVDGAACFVGRAYPGDRVRIALDTATRPPSATVLELLEPSPFRVPHPCPHCRECPGSIWGGFHYEQQLQQKHDLVERTLRKAIGSVDVLPTVASPKPWHYRNRIHLHVWESADRVKVGFQTAAREQSGTAVGTCQLADEAVDSLLRDLVRLLETVPAASLHPLPQRIQIHQTAGGAGMLLVFTQERWKAGIKAWGIGLKDLPTAGGFWFACGSQAGVIDPALPVIKTEHAQEMRTVWLSQPVDIHPAAFTQANAAAANLVCKRLIAFARTNPTENVWDLYGGFGALGFAAAPAGTKLHVLELSPHGDAVAKALAKMLHQNQLSYVAGDLLKTLPRHVGFMRERDVVLLDPPRSGVHREVLRLIVSARPKTLVYLSCNPAKLGRDLSMLLSSGFRLEEIQPYDFFPQTASLEVLCILKRTG